MKTLLSIAAAIAALTSATIASAHDAPLASGHYEWQSQPQSGPRASLRGPVRVWVSDSPAVADCDCAMMRDTAMAADCMAIPHSGGKPARG